MQYPRLFVIRLTDLQPMAQTAQFLSESSSGRGETLFARSCFITDILTLGSSFPSIGSAAPLMGAKATHSPHLLPSCWSLCKVLAIQIGGLIQMLGGDETLPSNCPYKPQTISQASLWFLYLYMSQLGASTLWIKGIHPGSVNLGCT